MFLTSLEITTIHTASDSNNIHTHTRTSCRKNFLIIGLPAAIILNTAITGINVDDVSPRLYDKQNYIPLII